MKDEEIVKCLFNISWKHSHDTLLCYGTRTGFVVEQLKNSVLRTRATYHFGVLIENQHVMKLIMTQEML